MAQMLRHKLTGELFIFTAALAALPEMEPVSNDPAGEALTKAAQAEAEAPADSTVSVDDQLEVALGGTPKKPGKK